MPYFISSAILAFALLVLASVLLAAIRGEPTFSILFKELRKLGFIFVILLFAASVGCLISIFL